MKTCRRSFLLDLIAIFAMTLAPAPGMGAATDPSSIAGNGHTPPTYDPTARYHTQVLQGWTVLISDRLDANPTLRAAALAELDHQLYSMNRRLPAAALARLSHVRVWLEEDDHGFPGGVYHPSAEWLRDHGYNPDKAKCVEIGNAQHLVDWSLQQPFMLLHEFSHAYHDQVLHYDYPPIAEAYKAAVESKRYDSVLHVSGKKVRHYALTNDQEFFAEMSEAFFGCNDFFPFVRGELKTYDPATCKVVADAWHVQP